MNTRISNLPVKIRKFIVVALILSATGILLNLLIDNPYTHQTVRILVREYVNSESDFQFDFKALKLSAIPPSVEVFGVAVDSKQHPGRSVARASHIKATLSIWSVILGKPKVGVLSLTDLDLNLPHPALETADSGEDHQQEKGAPSWPPQFELPIETIDLINGRIFYTMTDKSDINTIVNPAFSLALGGVDFSLSIDDWQNMELVSDISSISISADGTNYLNQGKLKGTVLLAENQISSDDLLIETSELRSFGALRTKLDFQDKSSLNSVSIEMNSDMTGDLIFLDKMLDIPGTKGDLSGKLKVKVSIPIETDHDVAYSVGGEAKVQSGVMSDFKLGNSAFKFSLDGDGINFSEIDLIFDDISRGRGTGFIKFNDKGNFQFKVQPERLPFTTLLDALTVEFTAFDADLYSDNLIIQGSSEPFLMDVTADSEFHKMRFPDLALDTKSFPQAPSCRLRLNMKINDTGIKYDGSGGQCFEYANREQTPVPSDGRKELTNDYKYVSPLKFAGYTTFNDKNGMSLTLSSKQFDSRLVRYFTQLDMEGPLELTTKIHGSYDDIKIANRIKAGNLRFIKTLIPNLDANIVLDDEDLLINNLKFGFSNSGNLRIENGKLTLSDELPIVATAVGNEVPEDFIHSLLNESLELADIRVGLIDLRVGMNGSVYQPFRMIRNIDVQLKDLQAEAETILDAAWIKGQQTDNGWDISQTKLRTGSVQVQLNAQQSTKINESDIPESLRKMTALGFDPTKEWKITLQTETPKLGAPRASELRQGLSRLPIIGNKLDSSQFDAGIDLTSNLSGPLHSLQGSISGRLKHLQLLGCPTAALSFDAFIGDTALEILLNQGGNALAGKLNIDLSRGDIPYELRLNLSRYDLRPVTSDLFFTDARNYLYASGQVRLSGTFDQWWNSQGDISLEDLTARYHQDILGVQKTISASLMQPFHLKIDKNGWNLDQKQKVSIDGNVFNLSLETRNNRLPNKLGINFSANIDAGIATLISPQIESASGNLSIDGKIRGSIDEPRVNISVSDTKNSDENKDWKPLSVGLADIRPAFNKIQLDLKVTEDSLRLDSLNAEKGNGTISSSGILFFDSARQEESRIDLNMKNASVIYPLPILKNLNSTLSGNLSLTGTTLPLQISGEMTIDRAHSTGDFDLRKEIFEALRKRSYSASMGIDDPLLMFDIGLKADKSIKISNRNINASISTDLQLAGSDINPNLRGQVEIDEGTFTYKEDFKITQGMITFDDPVRPDPKLDILAETEVKNYTVNFAVSGRASNPVVDLGIDPATRDDGGEITKLDILSLLSKGSLPPSRTNFADTGGVATAEVINIIEGQFEEPVEKLLDLTGQSIVRQGYIDTKAAENGQPVPRFNVPLNLGPDWDMIVRVEPDNWQMSSEYNLHENILIQGSVDGRDENETAKSQTNAPTDTGVDLKFRFSYP